MDTLPRISIITVCFNSERTIRDTILSVVEQDYPNIEYLVVDGGSSDRTVAIAREFADRISSLVSEPDSGIYDAFNKGVSRATGEYIGFLHADDVFADKDVVSRIAGNLRNRPEVLYGDLRYVGQDRSQIIREWKSGIFHPSKLWFGWMPPHPTMYLSRVLYHECGKYNTEYKIAADYDMILRVFGKKDLRVSYLPDVLVLMKIGGASNSSLKNILRKSSEDYKILKRNGFRPLLGLVAKNVRKLGQLRVFSL